METKETEWFNYLLDYNYDSALGNIKIVKNRYKKTDEETLEDMDFKVVEAFVRKKKLERITN